MTAYFYQRQIRIFDYAKWAEPLREALRQNRERLAADNALEIECGRSKKSFRKEHRVKEVLEKRGDHPGVVRILSAREPCRSYKPWHDKKTPQTYLKPEDGKCLHSSVYFMDEDLGLCSLRVPTGCPFRRQFYGNGPSVLARQMSNTTANTACWTTPSAGSPTANARTDWLTDSGLRRCLGNGMSSQTAPARW